MKQSNFIDDSAEVLARKLSTKLRDTMIARICIAFKDKPVTQQAVADLFGLHKSYVSRLIRHAQVTGSTQT